MKFLIDTNVVSELIRGQPDPIVLRWMDANDADCGVSWVTVAELRKGAALHPDPSRRINLRKLVDRIVSDYFDPDALPLTDSTANEFASLVASRKASGQSAPWPDAVIASIALDRGMTVATRNTKDFPDVPTVNPWEEKAPAGDGEGDEG
jgi:predicted nucleic acid-binding protein